MSSYDRNHPFLSRIQERTRLSQSGSTKKTFHLSLNLHESMSYQPGDSIAIIPQNHPDDVSAIMRASENHRITIQTFFSKKANLQKSHPALIRRIVESYPDAPLEQLKIRPPVDLLTLYPLDLNIDEIPCLFLPLLPRLYSIASSPLLYPHEAHLLVTLVEYEVNGQIRKGVASRFLCEDSLVDKTPIELYLQPSHHFSLPTDSSASIILIGAGTGVAPFRAFMQHRLAMQTTGRNWLFFGERHRNFNFYYQSFWEDLQKQKVLRLDLAFSRDNQNKIYVQDRMWDHRKDLWQWIQEGSYLYVCGDAKQMAKDVDKTLHSIAMSEGGLSDVDARHFLTSLHREMRYCRDIY